MVLKLCNRDREGKISVLTSSEYITVSLDTLGCPYLRIVQMQMQMQVATVSTIALYFKTN